MQWSNNVFDTVSSALEKIVTSTEKLNVHGSFQHRLLTLRKDTAIRECLGLQPSVFVPVIAQKTGTGWGVITSAVSRGHSTYKNYISYIYV